MAIRGYKPQLSAHKGQINKAIEFLNHASKPVFLIGGRVNIARANKENSAINHCDVLFSIGTRFNDRITGKIEEFAAGAKIIHIDIDAAPISRNIVVDVPIVADAKKAICSLLEKAEPLSISEWVEEISRWKKEYPIDMGDSGLTPKW